jgi:hypothetical protein
MPDDHKQAELHPSSIAFLDESYSLIESGEVNKGMTYLTLSLKEVRERLSDAEWDHFCSTVAQRHSLLELLHQDPFTRNAFAKSRGYPGDADLLDFMYRVAAPSESATEIGKLIFEYCNETGAPKSVRTRRSILARHIDEAASLRLSPRILSVACGHLREAAHSEALSQGRIEALYAFDQDAESLRVVERDYKGTAVRTICGSVRDILAGKTQLTDLDLIYSAGLYDYLGDQLAATFTTALFSMLRKNGRLIIANFAPTVRDIGYMEAFMGWKLIYRTPEQLTSLSSGIEPSLILNTGCFWDDHGNVVYLTITKA